VEDILFSLQKEKGITLIIVTHDEELAARCDRRVYVRDGRITENLTAAPATPGSAPSIEEVHA
jgi:putative ABC transport system ATP-binding protein